MTYSPEVLSHRMDGVTKYSVFVSVPDRFGTPIPRMIRGPFRTRNDANTALRGMKRVEVDAFVRAKQETKV